MQAEQRKKEIADQIAAEEAKIAQEQKILQFNANLPRSCKRGDVSLRELSNKSSQDKMSRAETLALAGDNQSACPIIAQVASTVEQIPADFVQCTKDIDANDDQLARDKAVEALRAAIALHSQQKSFQEHLIALGCR